MAMLENLTDFAKNINEKTPEDEVFAAYDHMTEAIPHGKLAEVLVRAFQSDRTTFPFAETVSRIFRQATPVQKAALLNKFRETLGSGRLAELLAARVRFGVLGKILSGSGAITPNQTEEIKPEDVKAFAEEALTKEPTVVNSAASFFAEHPLLMKTLGARLLVRLLSRPEVKV